MDEQFACAYEPSGLHDTNYLRQKSFGNMERMSGKYLNAKLEDDYLKRMQKEMLDRSGRGKPLPVSYDPLNLTSRLKPTASYSPITYLPRDTD